MRSSAFLVGFIALSPAAYATEKSMNDTQRTITCSGDAEIKVAPDEVSISLGVESFEKDLTKAKNDADDRVKRIIAAAIKAGVEEKRIATDQVSIEPHYDTSSYASGRKNDGFTVRRSVQITLRDVSKFDVVLSSAVTSGANVVHGVQFATTELRKHRDQAREMAMKAAHEKAVALAKTMGMKPGKPRSISEGSGGWWSGYGAWGWGGRGSMMMQNVSQNVGGGGAVEGTMAPGLISINASVTIVFDLE
jgi:uncharacterized protein YggE